MSGKKMGRPTDALKSVQIAVRFDNETLKTLDNFCEKKKISRAEGVRKAVQRLTENTDSGCTLQK